MEKASKDFRIYDEYHGEDGVTLTEVLLDLKLPSSVPLRRIDKESDKMYLWIMLHQFGWKTRIFNMVIRQLQFILSNVYFNSHEIMPMLCRSGGVDSFIGYNDIVSDLPLGDKGRLHMGYDLREQGFEVGCKDF